MIPHKSNGICHDILKTGLIVHYVVGIKIMGHIIQISRSVLVHRNRVSGTILHYIAFANIAGSIVIVIIGQVGR